MIATAAGSNKGSGHKGGALVAKTGSKHVSLHQHAALFPASLHAALRAHLPAQPAPRFFGPG